MEMKFAVNRWSARRFVLPLALVLVLAFAAQTQAQDQLPEEPAGNTRQPIVTDQFNTTSGGALQLRRPGLYVQQGIAVQNGGTGFFDGEEEVAPHSFIGQLVRDIFVTILDTINQALSLLTGSFGGDSPLGGLTDLLDQFGTAPTTTAARVLTPAPTDTVPDVPPAQ